MEKTVVTLGDLFTADAQRLMRRHKSTISWLDLIEPVMERNSQRAVSAERFDRREGVPHDPRQVPAGQSEDPAAEDPESEGQRLAPATRDRLRHLVGPDVELARIHVDKRADDVARERSADAVTVGKDIYFRSGKFAPQSPAGLGLIAHELTHVAEHERPGAGWRRATADGVRDEERLAHRRERIATQSSISPLAAAAFAPPRTSPAPGSPAVPPPSPVAAAASVPRAPAAAAAESPHLRPMLAETDRPSADAPPPAAPPAPSLDAIRRVLLRDVMNQIRVEFERGA